MSFTLDTRGAHASFGIRHTLRDVVRDKATIWAMGLAATLFLVSVAASYLTVPDSFAHEASGMIGEVHNDKNAADLCILILAVNYSTMLFLYSGVVSLGLSTLVSLFLSGAFLGTSVKVATAHHGAWAVLSQTFLYTPWEIAGFVIAGAAGLYPCVRALTSKDTGLISGKAMGRSLYMLALSSIVLLIAAIIESLGILLHH